MFAGPFASILLLAAAGAAILAFLAHPGRYRRNCHRRQRRAAAVADRHQAALVAPCCAVGTYALMSFATAPLAMVGCGLSTDNAMLGISACLAMFHPASPWLANPSPGAERIVATGLVLLIGCATVVYRVWRWQF